MSLLKCWNPLLIYIGLSFFVLLGYLAYRLLPESSPIAEASRYFRSNACIDCHTGNQSLALNQQQKPGAHPDFELQLDDALSYMEVVKLTRSFEKRVSEFDNSVIKGESLARRFQCFVCHGTFGQGGHVNKGALKGYIPGWFGRDFDLLTNDGDRKAIREWIKKGIYQELVEEPFFGNMAQYFFARQEIKMIPFAAMSEEDLNTLVNYVLFIRQLGPLQMDSLSIYESRSNENRKTTGMTLE